MKSFIYQSKIQFLCKKNKNTISLWKKSDYPFLKISCQIMQLNVILEVESSLYVFLISYKECTQRNVCQLERICLNEISSSDFQ